MVTPVLSRRLPAAFLCALVLSLAGSTPQAQPARPRVGDRTTAADARRAQFLEMFARAYYPGRTGQLLIVPREGDVLTRPEPDLPFMHGSPWSYDTAIPLLFVGASVTPGVVATPAVQQDVAVTLASALGVAMPPSASGHVLPVRGRNAKVPRAVFLLVLDGARADYFTKHAASLPTLSALRKRGAWFTNARVNYLPTNTAAGHSTIATGADPRMHGITGNNLFNRATGKRHDMYSGWNPADLMAPTLADVWQLETKGKAIVLAQGGNHTSSTALAGHGACQLAGFQVLHAAYDETTGFWKTNPRCFRMAPELASLDARTLWPADGTWMGHKIDTPAAVRRTGLFPRFEADAFIRALEAQAIGVDNVPDLLLVNLKSLDNVGHKHGPDSKELAATLAELDTHVGRMLKAVEAKVGSDYLLAITADHGMPSEPATKDRRRLANELTSQWNTELDPDAGKVIAYYEPENAQIFVDVERLAALDLSLDDMATYLRKQSFIDAVFTEDDVRRAAARLK